MRLKEGQGYQGVNIMEHPMAVLKMGPHLDVSWRRKPGEGAGGNSVGRRRMGVVRR